MSVAAPESVAQRGETLLELGRSDEAITILHTGLAEHPDSPELLDTLARAQLGSDAPSQAAATAERLIAVTPHSHRGYLLASIAYDRAGDRNRAINLAKHATERAPHNGLCHARLAQSLAGSSAHYKQAASAAREALALIPHDPTAHIAAGNVALSARKKREAERHYRNALALDPNNKAAQTNLAILNRANGHAGRALEGLRSTLHLDPQDKHSRELLDQILQGAILDLVWVWFGITALLLFLNTL